MKRIIKYITSIIIIFIFLFISFIDSAFNKNNNINNCNYINSSAIKELNDINSTLNIDYRLNDQYIISKIKYRNIYDFKNEITIYNGKNSGIKKNLAVINNDGLIGITKKVYQNKTKVELITNKKTNISVRINNTYGLLKSNNNNLIVDTITSDEIIKIGDIVYTSGIGLLEENIIIGTVSDIKTDDLELQRIVYVTPAVDFNNINYVFVVGGS